MNILPLKNRKINYLALCFVFPMKDLNWNYSAVKTDVLRETLWADGVLNPDTIPFD